MSYDPVAEGSSPDEWTSALYAEIKRLAARHLHGERDGHTLQATALVHEAYLRLHGREIEWESTGHFLAHAASVIRRVLIDHARTRGRIKRGGDRDREPLSEDTPNPEAVEAVDLLDLDASLEELAGLAPRQARIVELRYFGGLTMPEVAEVLGIAVRTAEADWTMAKAWLMRRLGDSDGGATTSVPAG